MGFYIDIFESRRTSFEVAEWWSQKLVVGQNNKVDYSKLAYEISPTGSFMCEEVSSLVDMPNQIGDLRHTSKTVTLSTTDDIMGKIFRDDIVRYDGRFWRVQSITNQREWRRSQFVKGNNDGTKIITLRG